MYIACMDVAHDKLLHFFWGAIISFFLMNISIIIGFIASLIIFAAKEIVYDAYLKKGNPELLDFVFSAVPAFMFLICKLNDYACWIT